MESSDKFSQSLEKEQIHDVMIYIDENDTDVKYNNSPRDKIACNSGHGQEENMCPNVVIPVVEIRDVSNGVIPNPPTEENNHSKKNIRLKGGDDNDKGFQFNTYADQFQSKEIRAAFIKKVYSILLVMLVVVASPPFIFKFSIEAHEFQEKYKRLIFVDSIFVMFTTLYALTCYEYVRKSVPLNFIVLTLYSLSWGSILSLIINVYRMEFVMMALIYTIGITLIITILAACCPIDLTKFVIHIIVIGTIIMLFTAITYVFLLLVYHEFKLAQLIFGSVGAVICSIYLAVDTQLILGGRKAEITQDEYIFAVVIILTDIISLFYYILNLVAALDG